MHDSTRLVSIVTPVFNAVSTIGDAVRSVQAQDYPDWEMIVVDDGSSDRTADAVCALQAGEPRLQLIRQANRGPAAARQRAWDIAAGRYIAFLDGDDWWLPGKLSRQVQFMRERDAPVSYTAFRRVKEGSGEVGRLIQVPARLRYRDLLRNTAMATSTVIIDREAVGPLRMIPTEHDDYALWLDVLKRGFTAHGLREDLMRYRVLGHSRSRNKLRNVYWVWRLYRDVEEIGAIQSGWYLVNYLVHALAKYSRF